MISGSRCLNRRAFIIQLIILASACAGVAYAAGYPPNTKLLYVPTPQIPMPRYLEPVIDPVFHSEVVRVSDPATFQAINPRATLRHAYSVIQPWNSDESFLLLGAGKLAALLDGHTYKLIKQFMLPPVTGVSIVWSNHHPRLLYTTEGNAFISMDVISEKKMQLHVFNEFAKVDFGHGKGNLSNDDRYAVLQGVKSDGSTFLLVYDLKDDTVTATMPIGRVNPSVVRGIDQLAENDPEAAAWPWWTTVSPSGDYIIICWRRDGQARLCGRELYDRNLHFLHQLTPYFGAHSDVGVDGNGHEVLVYLNRDAALVATRLDTGEQTVVLPRKHGGHVSCRNIRRPGWCYVSELDVGAKSQHYPGQDQIYAVKLDGSGEVEVFAQAHSRSISDVYSHEAQAVPNHDGSRVLWASAWDNSDPSAPALDFVASRLGPAAR